MVGGEKQSHDSDLIFAQDADDATLNFYVVGRQQDGSHFGIRRLQTYLAGSFAIEALESCFLAADQRHDDIAGVGNLGLLAYNEVAVHDVIFDHGRAFDLQHKGIAAARSAIG